MTFHFDYSDLTTINTGSITIVIIGATARTAVRELLRSITAYNKSAPTARIFAFGAASYSGDRAGRGLSSSERVRDRHNCRSAENETEKCDRETHIVYVLD
jgi:hypothetical protein